MLGEYSDESFTMWLTSDSLRTLDARFRLSTDVLQELEDLQSIQFLHLVGDYSPQSLSSLSALQSLTLERPCDDTQAAELMAVLGECVVRIQLQSGGQAATSPSDHGEIIGPPAFFGSRREHAAADLL